MRAIFLQILLQQLRSGLTVDLQIQIQPPVVDEFSSVDPDLIFFIVARGSTRCDSAARVVCLFELFREVKASPKFSEQYPVCQAL